MPAFARYIGIDYSGAETPNASLKGLRVYLAHGDGMAGEVLPPCWRRAEIDPYAGRSGDPSQTSSRWH